MTTTNILGKAIWGPPDNKVEADFIAFSSDFNEQKYLCLSEQMELRKKTSRLIQVSGSQLAKLIIEKRDNHHAASFIRISDGEGNLLTLAGYANIGNFLNDYCIKRISYIHFGDTNVIYAAQDFFGSMIRTAIETADLIGFPSFGTVLQGFVTADADKDVRAITGNRLAVKLSCDLANVEKDASLTQGSAWFSRDLLPHYREILHGQKHVGLISVYPELAKLLVKSFDISKVEFIEVPKQAVFVETRLRKNTNHYPDAMLKIMENIQPSYDGMIYLVAAGLLGKKYCSIVKNRGGIAVDIGSVAEIWLGIQARGMSADYIRKWSL